MSIRKFDFRENPLMIFFNTFFNKANTNDNTDSRKTQTCMYVLLVLLYF